MLYNFVVCSVVASLLLICSVESFSPMNSLPKRQQRSLQMIELDSNTVMYGGMFLVTMLPSLAFVKFIGDQADKSRGSISVEQKEKFKKAMMETPGVNLGAISTEEDALKRKIAKAYMQDKDVDVAILEQKLRERAQWRKELQQSIKAGPVSEDDDGW